MKTDFLTKYGKLVQFGTSYMKDFNENANIFLSKYNECLSEISEQGYSQKWYNWTEENQKLIEDLYDALNASGKIPIQPISS
jgi:hypothetical protein